MWVRASGANASLALPTIRVLRARSVIMVEGHRSGARRQVSKPVAGVKAPHRATKPTGATLPRRDAVTDRRLRAARGSRHRGAGGAQRVNRLAVPAALRLRGVLRSAPGHARERALEDRAD